MATIIKRNTPTLTTYMAHIQRKITPFIYSTPFSTTTNSESWIRMIKADSERIVLAITISC
jgi:hypothetical protein